MVTKREVDLVASFVFNDFEDKKVRLETYQDEYKNKSAKLVEALIT